MWLSFALATPAPDCSPGRVNVSGLGFSHSTNWPLNVVDSAPSATRVTGVVLGLPDALRYSFATIIAVFFSIASVPWPTQTKISLGQSTRKTSFVSSASRVSRPFASRGFSTETTSSPLSVLTRSSFGWPFFSAASSSSPGFVTSIFPPSAAQNAALSGSSSMRTMVARAPRSSERMCSASSNPFCFSARFALLPLYTKIVSPRSSRKTSPVVRLLALTGTSTERTVRLPLHISSRCAAAPSERSTCANPLAPPPACTAGPSS